MWCLLKLYIWRLIYFVVCVIHCCCEKWEELLQVEVSCDHVGWRLLRYSHTSSSGLNAVKTLFVQHFTLRQHTIPCYKYNISLHIYFTQPTALPLVLSDEWFQNSNSQSEGWTSLAALIRLAWQVAVSQPGGFSVVLPHTGGQMQSFILQHPLVVKRQKHKAC